VLIQVWRFWDFVHENNSNPIEDWYRHQLSDESRFDFDNLLKNICQIENHLDWGCFRGMMQGKLREQRVWELGFKSDRRQYRLLGVFGPQRREVVLLVGCYHKQKVYTPADALNSAYVRSKAVSEGRAVYDERKIRIDQ
jgi:hypothetical protein